MLFISYLAAIVIHDRNLEGMDHLKPCSRETVSSSSHDHKQCPIKKNDHKQCYASMDDRSNQSPWWGWRFLFPLLLFSISAVKLSAALGTGGTGTSRAEERPPVSRAPTADRRRRRECRSIRAGCLGHSDSYAQPILMPRPLRCLAVAAAKHAVTAHSIVPPARISSGTSSTIF